jgi:hypothetical protein
MRRILHAAFEEPPRLEKARGERAGAGERRAAEEKTASVQGFRRASS